jgi:hypothetical protein
MEARDLGGIVRPDKTAVTTEDLNLMLIQNTKNTKDRESRTPISPFVFLSGLISFPIF